MAARRELVYNQKVKIFLCKVEEMDIKPYIRRAQFYETDQMGIIHHANYIHWFEEARVDFMDQVGFTYSKALEAGVQFVLLGIACEYKAMVRFDDTVRIHLHIAELTPVRMTIRYELYNASSQALCTIGESRHCFFDMAKNRPTSLKALLPQLYDLFMALSKMD